MNVSRVWSLVTISGYNSELGMGRLHIEGTWTYAMHFQVRMEEGDFLIKTQGMPRARGSWGEPADYKSESQASGKSLLQPWFSSPQLIRCVLRIS